jgi:hypothetical protein
VNGSRKALLVANDVYEHEGLRRLQAPAADAEALARVLGDASIGDFTVQVLRNEPAHVVQRYVEDLFAEGRPDDLLLLHFSCHGLKSESGELFFASRNTRPDRLGSTAVSAAFVQRSMGASRSRSVVLLLDCCYGGAFSQGVSVRAGGDVHVLDSFPGGRLGGGRGRAVITASSAMEYAFEGDQLADDHTRRPSVFTSAVVDALATGEADRDQDGWVSLNELYDYVFDRVRTVNPNQTPSRDMEMQGELYLARGRAVVTPLPLPPELQDVVDHPLPGIRVGAVQELARLAHGPNAGLALGAQLALRRLVDDDSRVVSTSAAAALDALPVPAEGNAAAGDAGPPAGGPAGVAPDPHGPGSRRLRLAAADRLASPHRRRRAGAAAVAAVLALGGAAAAALLLRDGDTPAAGGAGVLEPGEFTVTAPWRLEVRDNISAMDNGCLVTVTKAGGGEEVVRTPPVFQTMTFQVRESGRFTWEANDPGCLVSVRAGPGTAVLPFAHQAGGDTAAFESPPRVAVTVGDFHGNGSCDFTLHDAQTGLQVDFGEVQVGEPELLLDPSGREQVYLNNVYCDVRVAAGPATSG